MKALSIKKAFSILLALCMIFSMIAQTGCAGDTGGESTPESTPSVTPESTPDESTPESTPDESTPEATPDESTPEATPDASTPESTPKATPEESNPESTPEETIDKSAVYNITYILDGGIGADENPDTYTYNDEDITLYVPVKKGYAFAGWTGTELEGATEKVVIPKGSYGDRTYIATWKEAKNVYNGAVSTETPAETETPVVPDAFVGSKDSNKNIATNPKGTPLSSPHGYADNGSGLFYVKTAYTDITVDGVMDNAYTYGLHFELDLPQDKDAYIGVDTTYDVYLVMGQDGKMHVYVKVLDRDIVINDEQWANKWWHCDVWQMYIDYDNTKTKHDYTWSFAAEGTKKYLQQNPENWIVVMTDDGFVIEYEFDNNGTAYKPGDQFGFSFFYNDSWDYESTSKYGRSNTRTGSVLEPATLQYVGPNPATQDGIVITSYPLDYEGELFPEDVPEEERDILKELATRESDSCVAYSTNSSAHTEITAEKLSVAISTLGVFTAISKEASVSPNKYGAVIYINSLTDADSVAMMNELHYAEYGVKVVNNKIITIGFQENAVNAAAGIVEGIFGYVVSGGDTRLVGTYTEALPGIPGENVPKVEGAQWITDSGDDAYVVHKLDTNAADYDGYKALLEAAGYKLHVENVVATVKNATYYTDDTVINVFYSTADKDLRVSVEPMYNTALPMLKAEEYEKKAESAVTLLNPNNLTMIVRLASGEFIVIDSGNRYTDSYIYNELKKQHTGDGPIVIAAWIFTHFHQDHQGGFIDYTLNNDYMADTVIKSIILNFPEKQVLDTASRADQINLAIWPTCIQICRDRGATLYQARTGQKYYFSNATVEILHTYDDLMPFFVRSDNTNHTNILFSIDIEGQRIMVTGDLTNKGFLVAANRYGEYLKSDILQASHHGYGDGSNDTTFYALVDADLVLVPGGSAGSAQKWAADNAKEVYYRTSGTKTFLLPYKIEEK